MTSKPSRLWRFLRLLPVGLVLTWAGCGWFGTKPKTAPPVTFIGPGPRQSVPVPKVRFTDITKAAGISFRHVNGSFGRKLLPETMGAGVAFLDFDNDGKQDLLFVNSCYWPGYEEKDKPAPTLALYRNKGNGEFE